MSNRTTNYVEDAQSDARDMARNFMDEITEQLISGGEASRDLLNDYPDGDSYHHENHVDRDYDLTEAANLLDQLSDHEETDSGLWQGLEPRRAIAAQAAYTYGNAVMHYWREIIEAINDDPMIADALADLNGEAEGEELSIDQDTIKKLVEEAIAEW
jgi:hypothetical protein